MVDSYRESGKNSIDKFFLWNILSEKNQAENYGKGKEQKFYKNFWEFWDIFS